MTQTERTERLRQIMARHKLSAQAVGDILDRSAQTVRGWRCKYDKRAIPVNELKLLELTLAKKPQAGACA